MSHNPRYLKSSFQLIEELRNSGRQGYKERMPRFGINSARALGVSVPDIRKIAGSAIPSKEIAMSLWASGIHEAMILSTMVFPADEITYYDAELMVHEIYSWDLCDHFTGNLIARTDFVMQAIDSWAIDQKEYVIRGAFALIAQLDRKKWYTEKNVGWFLSKILAVSSDNRNFVKKSVSWALREIGKSSQTNHELAMGCAEQLMSLGGKTQVWIAREAFRGLSSVRS